MRRLLTIIRRHKYAVTLLLFVVLIVFVDENNLIRRFKYHREEARLRDEVEYYKQKYDEDTRRLDELTNDSGAIERIAREKYLMKKPNEDIFIIGDGK